MSEMPQIVKLALFAMLYHFLSNISQAVRFSLLFVVNRFSIADLT